jgi:hypothetical protein
MKIYFGFNIPVKGRRMIDWNNGKPTWESCIRERDLFFEVCEICGSQIVGSRLKRGLTTCCPECNSKKWDRIMEQERTSNGRPLFWETFKFECFQRDNHICQECGSKKRLECHHIIPVVNGGTNELSNLITLCHDCHLKAHPKGYKKTAKRTRENQPLSTYTSLR